MNICIVLNKNARGLATDADLLTKYLTDLGHDVSHQQFDDEFSGTTILDLSIFLEVSPRFLLDMAPVNWLFCNPEFVNGPDIGSIHSNFSKVFCKTREAQKVCSDIFGGIVHFTGFMSKDKFNPSIKREQKFLHVAGNSRMKGTEAVIDAWRWKRAGRGIEAPLIVVSDWVADENLPTNVTVLRDISEEELSILQNQCRFHLQPSGTEGWSHTIHEAMSVNASVLTTAAPPMDEIKSAHKVQATGWETYNLAKVYQVSALDIHVAAKELLELHNLKFVEEETREEFLRGNEFFKTAFAEHLEDFVPRSQRMAGAARTGKMRISFLGNFAAEHSTENQIFWALEQGLGHTVECIQENEATLRKIDISCRNSDVFLWVRTPGWLKVEDDRMIDWLQTTQVPTASIHLDKFWGIPDREVLIGKIPFWKTKFVFTADGSRDEDFKKAGVNHFWMQPAVSEVYIHPGTPRDCYRCDVGFVGARDYHAEYPFRAQMIDFLERTYGNRFKHVTGVRGHELNDVYASMRLVVGDCIFAGTPRYWSDRVPETVGRYGFLLHPTVQGLDLPLPVYEPQDLKDLKSQIDLLTYEGNVHARREMIEFGVEEIREKHTWTVRMREILETIAA